MLLHNFFSVGWTWQRSRRQNARGLAIGINCDALSLGVSEQADAGAQRDGGRVRA